MDVNNDSVKLVSNLFEKWKGKPCDKMVKLPQTASDREYYRIFFDKESVIGAFNPNIDENIAFIEFTKHFSKHEIPVPTVICENTPLNSYLISDLGDTTLFSLLPLTKEQTDFSQDVIHIYKKVLEWLPEFQITAGKDINYDVCYPRKAFDSRSMFWDLNYFKYFFLKLGDIFFDEEKLEDEFVKLVGWLSQAPSDFFMFRDFQSRNIMILDNKPRFIDYQGGRKGPLQYDLASLLFDAKANIPFDLRIELLDYYIKQIEKYITVDKKQFIHYFYGFVLIRIFQAMGAYGFRGFHEKKPLFLQSIFYAQNNLKWLIENNCFPGNLPYLKDIAKQIIETKKFDKYTCGDYDQEKLTITVNSFSYKKTHPVDMSGNGGGFMFDCRALPNPGRYSEFKNLCGKDKPVIEYLSKEPEVNVFIEKTSDIVLSSAKKYIDRGFKNLMVSYGCTGGQHRSVFCAEKLAGIIKSKLDVNVEINHQQEGLSWSCD